MEQIKYQLRGVSIEQYATPFEPQIDNIEISVSIPIKTSYADRAFAIGTNIQFLEDDKPFIIAEVFCHFEIAPDSWSELSSDNTTAVVLPKYLARNLVAIAISTCRGVLCAKTEKTPFAKFFVPIINLDADSGDEIVIPLE